MRGKGRRPDEERQQIAIAWRDWALRRLRRVTATVVTGSALALAALSALAASAKPGAKTHPVSLTRRPAAAHVHVVLPRAIRVPRSRMPRQSSSQGSPAATATAPAAPVQAAPVPAPAPAPQPAPVAPQPAAAAPVTSSGGS